MDDEVLPQQIELNENIPLTLICEGKADGCFFSKMIEERRLQPFNVIPSNGFPDIEKYLKGIRADRAFDRTKGVLVVADSRNDSEGTFRKVATMLRRAGYEPIPTAVLEITAGIPRIAVMLLPGPKQNGSLETLCFDAMSEDRKWLRQVINGFLSYIRYVSRGRIESRKWSDEKIAKSRLCTLVAATFSYDPSRAISLAFSASEKKGVPQMISTKRPSFDRVERWLNEFSQGAMQ
jgi:hypothetical protein